MCGTERRRKKTRGHVCKTGGFRPGETFFLEFQVTSVSVQPGLRRLRKNSWETERDEGEEKGISPQTSTQSGWKSPNWTRCRRGSEWGTPGWRRGNSCSFGGMPCQTDPRCPRYFKKKKSQFFWLRSSGVNFAAPVRMRDVLKGACHKYLFIHRETADRARSLASITYQLATPRSSQQYGNIDRNKNKDIRFPSLQSQGCLLLIKPPAALHATIQNFKYLATLGARRNQIIFTALWISSSLARQTECSLKPLDWSHVSI